MEAALRNGEIDGRDYHENAQIDKMNWILGLIEDSPGITSYDLQEEIGVCHSTILTYCQWLVKADLIEVTHRQQGGVSHYKRKNSPSPSSYQSQ